MGKSIGVVSLKGGVGKTSTVVSMGMALAEQGKKVLLVDGNLSAPNLGMHFKILEPKKGIHNVLRRETNASKAIHKLGSIDVIPGHMFDNKKVSPLKMKDRIGNLKRKYDYVIYDSSPALNNETLAVMMASDEIFVVTTPDHPTLGTTIKSAKEAKKRGVPINGLILNKSYGKNFEISPEDVEYTSEIPVVAKIPHDKNVPKALSNFESTVEHKPNSEASKEYKKLASSISGEEYTGRKGLKDLLRKIRPQRQDVNRDVLYESVFS
ncbi:MAG: AAA family ATPase [Candidatus Pacearchaeota archaeon]